MTGNKTSPETDTVKDPTAEVFENPCETSSRGSGRRLRAVAALSPEVASCHDASTNTATQSARP